MTRDGGVSQLEAYLDASREQRLASYLSFLRIPSISTLPEHAADCRSAAEWVAGQLRSMGAEHVEVAETGGHPIAYGDWLHADGAPTVLVYGHYDVQPVDPIDLWARPPFEPVVEGSRVLGRGASDDKGQVDIHLRALEALLATRGRLPVNLKVVVEGEEENNSPHFDAWLVDNRARLAADLAVVSDSRFFDGNLPTITVGLRGILYAQIDVSGSAMDLHSGSYGGTVDNPANVLAGIIAALKGLDGVVRIPGFYDDVVPLSDAERAALADLPFDEQAYREALGVPSLGGEPGYTTLERRGARPTLDVSGMWAGFQGAGAKTIIPSDAHAKVGCRLVPNQDPRRVFDQLRAYVEALAPRTVRVDVTLLGAGLPTRTPLDHPATQAAARAIERTFGVRPVYAREGVSIPVCASLETVLGVPVLLLGFGPPDDQSHAPNEWMSLSNYELGIRTVARLWDELAATSGTGTRPWAPGHAPQAAT